MCKKKLPVKIIIHQTGYEEKDFDGLIKEYGKENVKINKTKSRMKKHGKN